MNEGRVALATPMDRYFATLTAFGAARREARLRASMEFLFDGVPLNGCAFLDVGAGAGIHSLYAASRGARRVVALEPQVSGSRDGATEGLLRLRTSLGLEQVTLVASTLQDFDPQGQLFDVVLLHNSINHLDEPACILLGHDPAAVGIYERIFAGLYALTRPGGRLIITDASRHNFFQLLRMRNPFAPTIEWRKHQPPGRWAHLLSDAGFVEPRVRWFIRPGLGNTARRLTGNPVVAYLTSSMFLLTMRKPADGTHEVGTAGLGA